MQMRQQVATEVKVKTQVNPGLLLLGKLLALNTVELDQQIEQELQENPALERVMEEPEKTSPLADGQDLQMTIYFKDSERVHERVVDSDEDEVDRLESTATFITLKEHLYSQLWPILPQPLHRIAHFLVESLDNNGYLRVEPEEIALRFNTDLEPVETVLNALQNCDPPGVGARTLQECLLLQIRSLKQDQDPPAPLEVIEGAERLLSCAWDDFTHGRHQRAARRAGLSEDEFEQTANFIRQELVPYPGAAFKTGAEHAGSHPVIEPDVVIRGSVSGFEIEIRGADPSILNINPFYLEQYKRIVNGDTRLTKQDQDHIRQYVERANLFLRGLMKRRGTIQRIVQYLVRTQHNFLAIGDLRFLQPVTRSELADSVGLHRSTIGRAVRNKFMQLPNGTVIPFEVFFKPAIRTALLIDQIIRENEKHSRRLTDSEIAESLANMGIEIARRTVAKYRNQSHILSSRWR